MEQFSGEVIISAVGGTIASIIGGLVLYFVTRYLDRHPSQQLFLDEQSTANTEIFPNLAPSEINSTHNHNNEGTQQITTIEDLMQVIGFSAKDLRLNRQGKISYLQMRKIPALFGLEIIIFIPIAAYFARYVYALTYLLIYFIVYIIENVDTTTELYNPNVESMIRIVAFLLFVFVVLFATKSIFGVKYEEGLLQKKGDYISAFLNLYTGKYSSFTDYELRPKMRLITIAASNSRYRVYYIGDTYSKCVWLSAEPI